MSETADVTTNLNIRISKSLKDKLNDFAESNGVQTTTLVISQIKRLLDSQKIDPEIIKPSSRSEHSQVKKVAKRVL